GLGSCRVRGGHRLQMQVRFGAVARVATAADHLPGSDLLVDANRGAGVLEVAQGHEDIVATVGAGGGVRLDHDVVPGHVGPAASYASRLGERVSHRGEPPVGGVVDLAVMDDAPSARDGGHDGPAEADEQLRGSGRRNEAAVYRELRPCSSTGTRSIEWE